MADAVTTEVVVDGPKSYVAHFTNVSDGTGETDVVKVDVSALSPACTSVAIEKIHYATQGMSVIIYWEATADTVAWICPEDQHGTFDFTRFGGITNSGGAGVTGDIGFSTVGHAVGDKYSIVLECRKIGVTDM